MPSAIKISEEARNAAVDAILTWMQDDTYSPGVDQFNIELCYGPAPAGSFSSYDYNGPLAGWYLSPFPFPAASSGQSSITPNASAQISADYVDYDEICEWFIIWTADYTFPVCWGTVGEAADDPDFLLNNKLLIHGGTAVLDSFTISMPEA